MTNVQEILTQARESLSVSRVYGEPCEKNGVTVIPAAAVRGGGGGGESEGGSAQPAGGGFGMMARPVGAFRIEGSDVSWIPAADTTRVIVIAEMAAIVAMLVLRSILRVRRRKH